ncbi:MAG: hypothetical protein KA206_02895 [Paludibacter sp.]|nr:hypothetical protein [Paludibacter sp.]
MVVFTTTSYAQEKSKLNYESGIGVSWEGNYGMVGMNQYNSWTDVHSFFSYGLWEASLFDLQIY